MTFGSGIAIGRDDGDNVFTEWGSNWGRRWGYNHDWDLQIDTSGDINTVEEIDELRKDIAFRNAIFLQQIRGQPLNPSNRAKAKSIVDDALSVEPRIDDVRSVSVESVEGEHNAMRIEVEILAQERELTVIFEV